MPLIFHCYISAGGGSKEHGAERLGAGQKVRSSGAGEGGKGGGGGHLVLSAV